MFRGDVLEAAFEKVAREELAKKIHEWIIYTAPPDILRVYHTYLEMIEDDE